ncbi:TPA: hypothetical protein ACVBYD_004122 [Yersinia enterocolitica]|uniref:Putative aconitate hydratase n=1 Tax=Yersinia enterocolitica TaxID=630 RepID=B0RKK4_YEREN|nr:hypothetical protein [Yersinia enterocolitica]AKF40365.1 hypothetical protein FORC2_p087 [Yersinia enterocolitica]ALG47365.1 hypothetical protein LI89_22375 [Yersinia enterocolitica]EKN3781844.1 hypothetical protein [Yersinia enterocolitica]EKN3829660.1 hypothetical protein [Yersinia enterocolitica]EKN3883177.1 hypothetical protein [Yersinia enterocolitica]
MANKTELAEPYKLYSYGKEYGKAHEMYAEYYLGTALTISDAAKIIERIHKENLYEIGIDTTIFMPMSFEIIDIQGDRVLCGQSYKKSILWIAAATTSEELDVINEKINKLTDSANEALRTNYSLADYIRNQSQEVGHAIVGYRYRENSEVRSIVLKSERDFIIATGIVKEISFTEYHSALKFTDNNTIINNGEYIAFEIKSNHELSTGKYTYLFINEVYLVVKTRDIDAHESILELTRIFLELKSKEKNEELFWDNIERSLESWKIKRL